MGRALAARLRLGRCALELDKGAMIHGKAESDGNFEQGQSKRLEVDEAANLDAKRIEELAEHVETDAHIAPLDCLQVIVRGARHLSESSYREAGIDPSLSGVLPETISALTLIHFTSANACNSALVRYHQIWFSIVNHPVRATWTSGRGFVEHEISTKTSEKN